MGNTAELVPKPAVGTSEEGGIFIMSFSDALEPEVRRTIHELWDCLDDPPGTCAVPADYEQAIPLVSFLNHDLRPNCAWDPRLGPSGAIVAERDLRLGEEATVNYFEYQDETSYTWRDAASGFKPSFVLSLYRDQPPRPGRIGA